jgi:hypothetical protein
MKILTYHTGVILKVQENTVCPSPGLALAHNNGRHNFLSQLRLSLLNCSHNHIANTASRESVETSTNTLDGDDVQISCAGVIAAVHDSATGRILVAPSQCLQSNIEAPVSKGVTNTGRPRVIFSLPPGAPRLQKTFRQFTFGKVD